MERVQRVVASQYAKAVASPSENLQFAVKDSNFMVWYCLVSGLGDDFEGGEYIFELTAPPNFPASPPSLRFLTPTGVFFIETKICISIGEFHQHDVLKDRADYGWLPAIGMQGFAVNALSALVSFTPSDHGIGIQVESQAERRKRAQDSARYNASRLGEIRVLFAAGS